MDSYKNFCVYFTHLPGSPPRGICIKFCVTGPLADVINRAKFYLNQILSLIHSRNYDRLNNCLIFPIDAIVIF